MKTTKNLLLLSAIVPTLVIAKQEKRPNIIILNIDDLGWTDISCNSSGYYQTPNIDQLKKNGVWFSNGYAAAANSAPSRACMLTGQYTPRHNMYTVGSPDRGKAKYRKFISIKNRTELRPNVQLLPKTLKAIGYQTCHIGKWHVTKNPLKQGIDINIAGGHYGHPKSYFAPYFNTALKDGDKGEYLPDRLGNEAVNFIQNRDKKKPFFLYYATYAVHTPLQAQKKAIEKYNALKSNKAHYNPIYAAMIEAMDRNVGKVLQTLEENQLMENTLLFFVGDNGGVYSISKQWPLRAGKGSFYEGGIRVPFIIYQKGVFEKKEIHSTPVSQIDIFPTIIDYLSLKKKNLSLDGKSLIPLLENKRLKDKERALYWHFPGYLEGGKKDCETMDPHFRTTPVSVIRKGDWKLIQSYETNTIELFNLKEDLSEQHECSKEYPKKAAKLFKQLQKWKQKIGAKIPTQLNPRYKKEN